VTDQDLRALVRDAVQRHLGVRAGAAAPPPFAAPAPAATQHGAQGPHPSHVMYLTLVNAGDACLIEPAVACNHCGYCKSHGH
jgi:hypothetical protein